MPGGRSPRRAALAIAFALAGCTRALEPAKVEPAPVAPMDSIEVSLFLIGDAGKVRWPRNLPAELHCHGIDPRAVNRAILRQSNLPRAIAAHDLRSAA